MELLRDDNLASLFEHRLAEVELFEGRAINFSNRLYESLRRALAEGMPLVVVFAQDDCTPSHKLDRETMRSAEMKALADRALWVRLNPSRDEDDKGNVAELARMLDIKRFPTTVVLDVTSGGIKELGRVVGYFAGKEMAAMMDQILPEEAALTIAA